MSDGKMTSITIHISRVLKEELHRSSKKEYRSMNSFVLHSIRERIDKIESNETKSSD